MENNLKGRYFKNRIEVAQANFMQNQPIPANEMERVIDLSEFDIDYTAQHDNLKDLTKLAAKVAGTEISLINLIDTFTLWTISNYGMESEQSPREETVCQYTIMNDDHFEIPDMRLDDRFKHKEYVTDAPNLRYYFGVPLKSGSNNLGALCVLDTDLHTLNPEKVELLKIIADEIVNRLKTARAMTSLKSKLDEAKQNQKKVAHDIRGPLGGIIGLAQIISEQGKDNQIDEVLEFINLIQKSGKSILELADEILSADTVRKPGADEFNLNLFKDKLDKLYRPQAKNKSINFSISINPQMATTPFSKNKLLQIAGNLISNAMKFTPENGSISVDLNLLVFENSNQLQIKVTDSGVGLNEEGIDKILNGNAKSTDGTQGEVGYGFGLALVKHLIDSMHGKFHIHSTPGQGATFEVNLPQTK